MVAVAAAILAGGRGTRLGGVVKPHIVVGDTRIIDRQLAVLRQLTDDIVVVGDLCEPLGEPFAEAGIPVIPDLMSGQGPLGGIAAALVWTPQRRCIVVAGDMPFVDSRVLAHLLSYEAPMVVPVQGKRVHALHAVYDRDCLPLAQQLLRQGTRQLSEFVARGASICVNVEQLRWLDPELRSLTNVNTLSDLQNATASVSC